MSEKLFNASLISVAVVFTAIFFIVVIPPQVSNPDIVGALLAGFVNPYAAGYSADTILCGVALLILVVYDAKVLSVRFGWVCLILALFPGVAVGLSIYLILRSKQIYQVSKNA